MRRPGPATLPSAYLLNHGIRRTLKTKPFEGRDIPHFHSIRSLTVCRVDISPKHKIPFITYMIIKDQSHVLYLPARKRVQAVLNGRYDERQEGLWMEFISNSMQEKRVVRSWARRRLDQAVTADLRTRGFGRDGRRVVGSDVSTMKGSKWNTSPVDLTVEHAPEALIGTVNIHVLHKCIETSFTEVQRQATLVVDKILEICGRYPRHGKSNRQQESRIISHGKFNFEKSSRKVLGFKE